MTDVGELVVRIRADAAQLEREMKKAGAVVQQGAGGMEKSFGRLRSEIASLAPTISALALVGFAKHAFQAADRLNDLAQRTGVAGSTLSALENPLKKSGSSVDDLSGAMIKLNNVLGEAVGSKEAAKNFEAIGLSVSDLLAMSPEERLYAVAKAINGIGDESAQTNGLLAVMGRGAGTLLPLFKELGDDLDNVVKKQKELGHAITDAELRKIDEFGDMLTENIHSAELVAIRFIGLLNDIGAKLAQMAIDSDLPLSKYAAAGVSISYVKPDVVSDKDLAKGITDSLGIPNEDAEQEKRRKKQAAEAAIAAAQAKAAAEASAKTMKAGKEALDEYTLSLERQNKVLQQTPREQAALEVSYKLTDLAKKAGITLTQEQIAANMELARTNYDLAESMQEAARFQQILHDKLSQTLTDIAFRAGSAKEAMLGFAESIAKAAFEKKVAGPLADALIGTGGGKGLLDDAIGGIGSVFGGFFADGGSPPVGLPSIVGERGPEIFVPKTAGTIIPNGAMGGGQQIQVINHWHVSPGVEETVEIGLRRAAPAIVSQSVAAMIQAAQHGGAASRVFGKRS